MTVLSILLNESTLVDCHLKDTVNHTIIGLKIKNMQTCPFDPYALYRIFPFSSFPPHLLMAAAKNVALTALCAVNN